MKLRTLAKALGWLALAGAALLLALAGWSALGNRSLPRHSTVVDRLSAGDRARLAEAEHLRRVLGDSVWPGWAGADIPVVLYNEEYAFLVGLQDPTPGWTKVPSGRRLGGPWEPVPAGAGGAAASRLAPADSGGARGYYRARLPGPRAVPEAFTVKVGDRWAASLQTLEWLRISLIAKFREELPPPLAAVFPQGLAADLFIGGTDGYIAMTLHEAFHAFQGMRAPERLAAAERAAEHDYPADAAGWTDELQLLRRALGAATQQDAAAGARAFLEHRRQRRQAARLDTALVRYEQLREWLEGLAKYVENESWRQAAAAQDYQPVAALAADRSFRGFRTFPQRWQQELVTLQGAAGSETRFYYAGMAQACLLDRLAPGWKERAMPGNATLEELLAGAVGEGAGGAER
jgi:hypothetical protein